MLYVICPYFNPENYESRFRVYQDFKRYMGTFENVVLIPVEMALGYEPFVLYDPTVIQVRGYQSYWVKETLINIGISNLPPEAKYVAWVDVNIIFVNPNWVQDTIDGLKKHKMVQMFSEYANLNSNYKVLHLADSFIATWKKGNNSLFDPLYGSAKKGVTGLAWAARRDVLDNIGGLLDWMIVGSSDWYMAYAVVGEGDSANIKYPLYKEFQAKCDEFIGQDVGYVNGCAIRYWHGPKTSRGYDTRWKILINNQFDPSVDLTKLYNGLYSINSEKTKMIQELQEYFVSRNEDAK